jgi:hypothetical protein
LYAGGRKELTKTALFNSNKNTLAAKTLFSYAILEITYSI